MKKLKYNNDSNLPVCMASGMSGNGDQVVCAHIAPCSSKEHLLAKVGLTKDDTGSTRNGLFLSKGFELAFDRLQLSFIRDPKNPLDSSLYLKIWDDSCRSHELWAGCDDATIGEYDGWKLNLNGHEPFKRALSYQAYQAYSNCPASEEQHEEPIAYGTPVKCFQEDQTVLGTLISEFTRNLLDEDDED